MDLFHQDKFEESLEILEKAIQINPAYSTFAWFYRAKSLKELKRFDDALACYDTIIEMAPESKESWCYKGDFLFFMERYDEAIKCYDRAIKIDDDYFYARKKRDEARQIIQSF